jgi:hypothetical protein
MIVQGPLPPTPPPDIPVHFFQGPDAWIPIAGMATGIIIVGMLIMGPVGRAIGDILRHWFGARSPAEKTLPADLDEVHARLDQFQQQLGELAERQDFSERLLARVKHERVAPGGSDVAG